jgi:uncharacterized protein (TIGR00369 family)
MMTPKTHDRIDRALCGAPIRLDEGEAMVELETTSSMAVDRMGLVHGGFIFGLADHAAMLAVNDPNVVLGGAEVKFVAPVKVGAVVRARARRVEQKGRKQVLVVRAEVEGVEVFEGRFTAFVLERHVLDVR